MNTIFIHEAGVQSPVSFLLRMTYIFLQLENSAGVVIRMNKDTPAPILMILFVTLLNRIG